MTGDCLFCKIAAKEIPAELVYEGKEVVGFRDINPQAPTHIQIIPRTHVSSIADYAPERDSAWLGELIEAANELARREGLERGYRLVVNNGPQAGQTVFHVHLHLLGGRPLGWPPG